MNPFLLTVNSKAEFINIQKIAYVFDDLCFENFFSFKYLNYLSDKLILGILLGLRLVAKYSFRSAKQEELTIVKGEIVQFERYSS